MGHNYPREDRRSLPAGIRLRVVVVAAIAALAVGVAAASGALGIRDTATGAFALFSETNGDFNTADGWFALSGNTTGSYNTAVGVYSLSNNTTGYQNTATGFEALKGQNVGPTGHENTADGVWALSDNAGDGNTAVGFRALGDNNLGSNNVAVGHAALAAKSGGSYDTAVGDNAGNGLSFANDDGSYNTFLGADAGPGSPTVITHATAVGADAIVSQSNSLVLGGPRVNVGIGTSTPRSHLQVGAPTMEWGDYVQLPLVSSKDKQPPVADCNSTSLVGRLVLQYTGKALVLWACSPQGVWKLI